MAKKYEIFVKQSHINIFMILMAAGFLYSVKQDISVVSDRYKEVKVTVVDTIYRTVYIDSIR